MTAYSKMTAEERKAEYAKVSREYEDLKARGLKLNMARGKPGKAQLDLVSDIFSLMQKPEDYVSDGIDVRNYGELSGLPAARRLFAEILGCKPEQVFVGGNASLQLMYDTVSKAYTHGLLHSERPWCKEPVVKFLCPSPGYDRHFKVTESFGFELITIPMTDEGPDMDAVEKAIQDPAVKGMWNVPKYSNPDGIIYSAETIRRIASMKPAAPDFLLMWDNAYCIHEFEGDYVEFPDILAECAKYGNADMVFEFASTSKVTLPGAGISCFACSEANMAYMEKLLTVQVISFDKVNQQRHVLYPGADEAPRRHHGTQVPLCGGRPGPGDRPAGDRLLAAAQGRLLRLPVRHARHCQADAGAVQGGRRHHDRRRRHLPLRQGPPGQQHPHRPVSAPR